MDCKKSVQAQPSTDEIEAEIALAEVAIDQLTDPARISKTEQRISRT
jgi:hypothetical protein